MLRISFIFPMKPKPAKLRQAPPERLSSNIQPSSSATSRLVGRWLLSGLFQPKQQSLKCETTCNRQPKLFRRVRWLGQQSRSVKSRTEGRELLSAPRVVTSVLERHRLEWHGPQKL